MTHRSLISPTDNFINRLKCSLVSGLSDLSKKKKYKTTDLLLTNLLGFEGVNWRSPIDSILPT